MFRFVAKVYDVASVIRFRLWYLVLLASCVFILYFFSDIFFWFNALVDWYGDNINGATPSFIQRAENYHVGIELLSNSFPYGLGMGGVQVAGIRGLSSFYLALLVQLGLFCVPLIAALLVLLYYTILMRDIWLLGALGFSFLHLFIIDTFYLPQILLTVLFIGIRYEERFGVGVEN